MRDETVFFNPFRMLSPKLDEEASRIERLHEEPVQESVTLERGLLMMISKVLEITRLLSQNVDLPSAEVLDKCEAMAREVHEQEQMLTRNLVAASLRGDVMKGLIRFPCRLERIGDLLESILNCFRIKARDGLLFSEKAHAELDQMLSVLEDMMVNLRDAFLLPNKVILEAVVRQGTNLAQMIDDYRLAHWDRLEGGFCQVEASSMYRDILDSAKGIGEYLVRTATTLLELGQVSGAGT